MISRLTRRALLTETRSITVELRVSQGLLGDGGRQGGEPVSNPLILLARGDNVLVCAAPITAGQPLEIDGETFVAPGDVPRGHKVARHALVVGDKVLKYGAPIGSMTAPAPRGGHVHVHNLASDYIPSHSRDAAGAEETH